MVKTFISIYTVLEAIVYKLKVCVLDNEGYHAIKNFLKTKNIVRHQVEAHNHNADADKPAVASTKYHLISHVFPMGANCLIQLRRKMIK